MGRERLTVRFPVRRWRPGPPGGSNAGRNGLEADEEHRCGRLQFPRKLQFLLDAFSGAQISRKLRQDGDEEAVPGPGGGGAPGYQRLLHRSVNASRLYVRNYSILNNGNASKLSFLKIQTF